MDDMANGMVMDDVASGNSSMDMDDKAAAGLADGAMFYETSALLITFVALGKALEAYSKGHTGSAVRSLLALQESEATLLELIPPGDARPDDAELRAELAAATALAPAGGLPQAAAEKANAAAAASLPRDPGDLSPGKSFLGDPAGWPGAARLFRERVVDGRLLQRGDLVLVKGGQRLPCDGTLLRALGSEVKHK
jgi:cation transport ATPase